MSDKPVPLIKKFFLCIFGYLENMIKFCYRFAKPNSNNTLTAKMWSNKDDIMSIRLLLKGYNMIVGSIRKIQFKIKLLSNKNQTS